MTWIEPLALQQWFINVFAGDIKYFTAIVILIITSLAGYFRMTMLNMAFMIFLFLAMFKGFIDPSIYFLMLSIGGFVVGYWIRKMVSTQ